MSVSTVPGSPVRPSPLPLLVAVAVLLGSLVGAVWLVAAAPEAVDGPTAKPIEASAEYSAYGGDAYTGIQNAAADTANAVVLGSNTTADLLSAIYDESAAADARRWAHLYRALAVLLVLLGVANVGRTLQRRVPSA